MLATYLSTVSQKVSKASAVQAPPTASERSTIKQIEIVSKLLWIGTPSPTTSDSNLPPGFIRTSITLKPASIPSVQTNIASKGISLSISTRKASSTSLEAGSTSSTKSSRTLVFAPNAPLAVPTQTVDTSFWLDTLKHQGFAPYSPSPSIYKVYRNIKAYGAKGDGKTDDTNAINKAITDGNRSGLGGCDSSTTTPALIYFPPGTYMISAPINAYYFSQLIGNPKQMPIIKAVSRFQDLALINCSTVASQRGFKNNFYRVIRNFIIDTTDMPPEQGGIGVHYVGAQATSLSNIIFKLSTVPYNTHQGVYTEEGSGGFMSDLTFYGGKFGIWMGNQQFTLRKAQFHSCQTAIYLRQDYVATFSELAIEDCGIGIDITGVSDTRLEQVGSVTLFDSSMGNVLIGIKTDRTAISAKTAASLVLENIITRNVPNMIFNLDNSAVFQGSTGDGGHFIAAYVWGNVYYPANGVEGEASRGLPKIIKPRPPSLMFSGGNYVFKSKPQYENLTADNFISAKSLWLPCKCATLPKVITSRPIFHVTD